MEEAEDTSVPLIERLKFVSIFTSNLDEFFMIRVGSLLDLMSIDAKNIDVKSGMTPGEQLDAIFRTAAVLYEKRNRVFSCIEKQLRFNNIYSLAIHELTPSEQKYIKNYFKVTIAPILSPQIVDAFHPFPHLQNKVPHVAATLKRKKNELFGIIPVPSTLPEVVFLPGDDIRYVQTEKIILSHIDAIFNMYEVTDKVCFCVTRNCDISDDTNDEEIADINIDFRKKIKKLLHKRTRLAAVRIEMQNSISDKMQQYLCEKTGITAAQIFVSETPFNFIYAFSIENRLPPSLKKTLTYKEFIPQWTKDISPDDSIIKQVLKNDLLLSYPFESMAPFLSMVKEAAYDPAVISIKITIYRLASKAKLVDYLCAAAENGKDVTILIELRARFDEQNNIDWSERLEDAGCKLIYGFEDFKVHSKVCIIIRREKNEIKYITHIGTGNFNEKTAHIYTDISLITSNNQIGKDAFQFFTDMAIGNLEGKYSELIVAPGSFKNTILALIDTEIAKENAGKIIIKINSITDIDIINKLSQASCAGVKIKLIVRGICCILPNISNYTDNISISNVVGRFLEHSRIYCFGEGENEKIYISSGDFMTRNTERRVEVACPVYSKNARDKINHILTTMTEDNVKARELCNDGTYSHKSKGIKLLNSHEILMREAINSISISKKDEKYFIKLYNHLYSFIKDRYK